MRVLPDLKCLVRAAAGVDRLAAILIWLSHLAEGRVTRAAWFAPRPTIRIPDRETVDSSRHRDSFGTSASRSRTACLRSDSPTSSPTGYSYPPKISVTCCCAKPHHAAPGRLVYLAHTPQWYPFGPASWHTDAQATSIVRNAAAVIAISHAMASYIEQHCGVGRRGNPPADVWHSAVPTSGSFDDGYVLMVNPCVVKGNLDRPRAGGALSELPFCSPHRMGDYAERSGRPVSTGERHHSRDCAEYR